MPGGARSPPAAPATKQARGADGSRQLLAQPKTAAGWSQSSSPLPYCQERKKTENAFYHCAPVSGTGAIFQPQIRVFSQTSLCYLVQSEDGQHGNGTHGVQEWPGRDQREAEERAAELIFEEATQHRRAHKGELKEGKRTAPSQKRWCQESQPRRSPIKRVFFSSHSIYHIFLHSLSLRQLEYRSHNGMISFTPLWPSKTFTAANGLHWCAPMTELQRQQSPLPSELCPQAWVGGVTKRMDPPFTWGQWGWGLRR